MRLETGARHLQLRNRKEMPSCLVNANRNPESPRAISAATPAAKLKPVFVGGVTVTLVVFGILPIGVVSAMMLTDILGR